jgi:acetate kinase
MPTVETQHSVLTINGGSSSIKFALYRAAREPTRLMGGEVERVGSTNHAQAAQSVVASIRAQPDAARPVAIGHRIVHGGAQLLDHQPITPALIAELKRIQQLDRVHLPGEIALIEAMQDAFPATPQFACFDTAFHRHMPSVAQLLPIPRHYQTAGVRRFGFHGLSYTYLMDELRRTADPAIATGRVILAHLGNGASMAAVHNGRPVDTTMAFTPTAGLVMGTRPGDLDPGLLAYLTRVEDLTPDALEEFIIKRCGLLGVSETSSDMRDLIAQRTTDPRAAEAVELFCYSARKWIGALAAIMGGLDTIVFSGGIGEHSVEVRAEICAGLQFLGVQIDPTRNATNATVISTDDARVAVRVIRTDEEIVIARTVCSLLGIMGS